MNAEHDKAAIPLSNNFKLLSACYLTSITLVIAEHVEKDCSTTAFGALTYQLITSARQNFLESRMLQKNVEHSKSWGPLTMVL